MCTREREEKNLFGSVVAVVSSFSFLVPKSLSFFFFFRVREVKKLPHPPLSKARTLGAIFNFVKKRESPFEGGEGGGRKKSLNLLLFSCRKPARLDVEEKERERRRGQGINFSAPSLPTLVAARDHF